MNICWAISTRKLVSLDVVHNCNQSTVEAENQGSQSAWDVYQDPVSKEMGRRMKRKGKEGEEEGEERRGRNLKCDALPPSLGFPPVQAKALHLLTATDFGLVEPH